MHFRRLVKALSVGKFQRVTACCHIEEKKVEKEQEESQEEGFNV